MCKKEEPLITLSFTWPASIPRDHINEEFIQGMLDRMAFGFHNYGHVKEQFPHIHDALGNLALRVKTYRKTKNLEFLMDAANYSMIEFSRPRLKGAFFTPTSREESPGSIHRKEKKIVKGKDDTESARIAAKMYKSY